MGFNVAIDGPAGAGKSTIAKQAAKEKGFIYVDTGALYRAIGYYCLTKQINMQDQAAVIGELDHITVSLEYQDGMQQVLLNNENITDSIRREAVGNAASAVSQIPEVRAKLLSLQQQIAAEQDVVMDGRDIGTKVLPQADVKVYLTASTATRAKRRFDELKAKGESPDLAKIEHDIEERDYRDTHRSADPLRRADDAVLVDSSDLTIPEVVSRILALIRQKEA